jgi:hypothetical protein
MKLKGVVFRAAAFAAAAACAGCAQLGIRNPFAAPLPQAQPAYHAERPAPETGEARPSSERAERRRASGGHRTTRSAPHAPEAAKAAAPASAPTITLGGDDRDRANAQHMIDDAGARLAHIDRSKLSADDASSYNQASGFVTAARAAMDQRDYLAASSLARKAWTISQQLAVRTVGP